MPMPNDSKPVFKRILLKLSGEALMGGGDYGIDTQVIARMAGEVRELQRLGVEIGLVIGGGNLFRGEGLARAGMDRVTADHMGMLATVMNSLAMQDTLERLGVFTRVMSDIRLNPVCADYIRRSAIRHLEKGRVVIFGGGTGNPYFSTDTAAALRATEIGADVVIKATKVDGVYDSDPHTNPNAARFDHLTHMETLSRRLNVMDSTAVSLCMDNNMPILVLNLWEPEALIRALQGEPVGTLVSLEQQD